VEETNMQKTIIGVVGAGLMGHGIAQDFASAGHSVLLHDIDERRLSRAQDLIRENLHTLAGLQVAGSRDVEEILSRVSTEKSLPAVAERCDYIVETVVEDVEVKQEVFSILDQHAPAHAIFASNTSSLLVDQIAGRFNRADRMLVTHYFNPPYLVPLVEVVRGSATSDETARFVTALLQGAGKKTAVLRRAIPGFIVNRLQAALVREAVSLVEKGIASHEDIDTAVRNSIAPRMSAGGIFEVYDLTGWDIVRAVCDNILPDLCTQTQLGNPARRMVADGHLGVKSMQGFSTWSTESVRDLQGRIAQALSALHRA
jgi:3-hydroxybutyryl-CoA dehydrogenase